MTIAHPVTSLGTAYTPPGAPQLRTRALVFPRGVHRDRRRFLADVLRPIASGTTIKNIHGITSSLWYFALMAQSWLMSRGLVTWHRRADSPANIYATSRSLTT
jgi:hypothetical protein